MKQRNRRRWRAIPGVDIGDRSSCTESEEDVAEKAEREECCTFPSEPGNVVSDGVQNLRKFADEMNRHLAI